MGGTEEAAGGGGVGGGDGWMVGVFLCLLLSLCVSSLPRCAVPRHGSGLVVKSDGPDPPS